MTILAFALAYSGFTAICLSMDKHHRQVWRRPVERAIANVLRASGFVLLAAALVVCTASFPGSLGIVVWLGLLTAAGVPLVIVLPYAPRAAAAAAAWAPIAAVTFLAWA